MSELKDAILSYYKFRVLEMPNESQAFQFFVSEVGELADALVSSAGNWTRNNPDREKDIEGEVGDVLMMLTVTMMERGIDPFEAMLKKFARKGFVYEGKGKLPGARAADHPDCAARRRPRYAVYAGSRHVPDDGGACRNDGDCWRFDYKVIARP